MTKEQLNIAQGLWSIYDRADELLEQLEGTDAGPHVMDIASAAARAFIAFTGKHPTECRSLTELNNEHPSEPWKSI